jgi:hypothetical protein
MTELERAMVDKGLAPASRSILGVDAWEYPPLPPKPHLAWSEAAVLVAVLAFIIVVILLLHG